MLFLYLSHCFPYAFSLCRGFLYFSFSLNVFFTASLSLSLFSVCFLCINFFLHMAVTLSLPAGEGGSVEEHQVLRECQCEGIQGDVAKPAAAAAGERARGTPAAAQW